jgi:3-dehydroquinate synthase
MQELVLQSQQRNYPIFIGQGLIQQQHNIQSFCTGDKVLIVSNPQIASHYAESVKALFSDKTHHIYLIAEGENEKNLANYSAILDYLIKHQFRRNDCLIALGGGVIGDLGGFVAASYQRGMNLIQLPTSLLAQVDSSVGGKTAVNHPQGKNLIGAFYQPHAVLIDLNTLATLPQREYISGLAEIVKYAILGEAKILELLQTNTDKIIQRDPLILEQLIYLSCAKKADVVAQDETEKGARALLNLGHSFGHAIEKISQYAQYLHGEAVAIGLHMAINLSQLKGMLSEINAEQYHQLLSNLGLPQKTNCCKKPAEILDAMLLDKKNLNHKYRLILPTDSTCVIVEEPNNVLLSQAIEMQITLD